MNNKIILSIFVIVFVFAIAMPLVNANSGTYTIIENGLPAGTQWEYINNGVNYTTTNNVVQTNGIDIFYPVYGYAMHLTQIGNIYYLNYTNTNSQGNTIQKLIPYGIITLLIIAPIAIAIIIKRYNNEE